MKGKVLTSWSLIWLLATVMFVAVGALNLLQRAYNQLPPTDGVVWVQKSDGIYAESVRPGSTAYRAGIAGGDKLIGIGFADDKIEENVLVSDIYIYLEQAGVGGNLTYLYQRPSYSFADNFYYADLRNIGTQPRWTPSIVLLSLVGAIWLAIGVFVLLKQGSRSPFVLHFASVCLVAFVFHSYRTIGLGEDFDLAVKLLDDMAFAFFVPLFLHFCLRYPVRSEVFDDPRWMTYALYVPAALISLATLVLSLAYYVVPGESFSIWFAGVTDRFDLINNLDLVNLYHFIIGISLGAGVLVWRFVKNKKTVVRQRLKWAMWGTVIAVIPIVTFQIAKRFVFLPEDGVTAAMTILPLALIPLSFGHSVVRYRLMDVDVVVRRAFVYALTTIAISGMIGVIALGLVFLAIGENLSNTEIALRGLIAVVAMAAIVLLSEPLKNFLQERTERYFYGEKYDLRRGLLDFGRTLSSTTALEPLLNSLTERLQQVLDVEKVAVFIEDESTVEGYRIGKSIGLHENYEMPSDFRTMIRQKSAKKGVVRADEFAATEIEHITASGGKNGNGIGIVRQELHYFVPCVVRGKMVAVIGLGRAKNGSLLSSEDISILQTAAGYVAIAVENSLLYQEQEARAEELALLKEFNESIVESVNVGLIAVDENGCITRCNSSFEEILGYSAEQSLGREIKEIFDEPFAQKIESILGEDKWHLTEIHNAYKLKTKGFSGESLTLNVAIAPLRSMSQNQKGAIVVIENVTQRVKFEESLQQNEKLSSIGLLAAGVAHEVNTPLTGVSSYTQMLMGMIPETDPKHALLQKVQKQTDRATNIVGNLLNFSRSGNATEFTEIDVNNLLEDTLQLLEPQLRKANVEISKFYADVPPIMMGDAGKLQQVFTNLIINARDAILNGGEISLLTKFSGVEELMIEVSDTGTGIEPEHLNKIFDPFFTTKAVGSGTGLGMAVSYGIVQEHAGTISATSKVGEGTTFRLVFPVAIDEKRRFAS
ncbi:MAG: PAS domain S-box protein [Acidobacteria bacterium]|nr:PAS domain S-box protein [Acidobacteriota bacterium]